MSSLAGAWAASSHRPASVLSQHPSLTPSQGSGYTYLSHWWQMHGLAGAGGSFPGEERFLHERAT